MVQMDSPYTMSKPRRRLWAWLRGRYDIKSLETCDKSDRRPYNEVWTSQIRELKDINRSLLQHIEALENKTSEWRPKTQKHIASVPDITGLANTVAEEMQARKDEEFNFQLVIYDILWWYMTFQKVFVINGKKKLVINTLSVMHWTSCKVPTMNVTKVFRMGRKLLSRSPENRDLFRSTGKC